MQREAIEGKMVFVVESHHEVLEAWGQLRCNLERAPNLITLDFHTDTHEPFDYHLYETGVSDSQREAERSSLLGSVDYTQEASLRQAISRLKHDEHILTAIQLDIIAAAFLVCQDEAKFTSVFETEESVGNSLSEQFELPGEARTHFTEKEKSVFFAVVRCARDCEKPNCDEDCNQINRRQVIEPSSLKRYLEELDSKAKVAGMPLPREIPYILDIDLDFFSYVSSAEPVDPTFFHELIRGAQAITIAIERGCSEDCWSDDALLNIEVLLGTVKKHIANAMCPPS